MNNLDALAVVHPNAAGLDIGSHEIWAAIRPDHPGETVRRFATFTPDLEGLADWLLACGVDTVAMESTGVYWIPAFEVLEQRGIECFLVNARSVRHVPGRKSDVQDCQWLQKLHSLGLLSASFRPDAEMRSLRTLLRHRAQLIQHRAPHILHMQKALQQMNLHAPRHGGYHRRDRPQDRARHRRRRARPAHPGPPSSPLLQVLRGDHRQGPHRPLAGGAALRPTAVPRAVRLDTSKTKNKPADSTRAELFRITGVDLVAVDGISASLAQTILSEIGTDMSRFPSGGPSTQGRPTRLRAHPEGCAGPELAGSPARLALTRASNSDGRAFRVV
ncbi:IS110 family RNA-guided transposase [Chloroflexus aggregans]|uniref:Transposase n=1 Tax=Chloroflexus aggregans (strain MD-66 / DSM 9485) TaxID=326427 RepID=B8G890_CHLAD|nr:IS110 family transposase [Chloroflexus aggregans]ACL26144.1 transposase [Chloroflexus aggregans DSM 9485]